MFITDFSSLAFDFGYMNRPVIYYQYDEEEYFKGHYIKGYFDYRRDGFGPVCNSYEQVIKSLKGIVDRRFSLSNQFQENIDRFFPLFDNNNSKRIYDQILKLKIKDK